jgi:MFS family permease
MTDTSIAADGQDNIARDRLVIVASSLGTIFEWYDFFVYGILGALIGKLFFPSDNPTAATLASLAVFGAGFGVRPLGAILFGYLGDKVGRKYTFLVTISLMGVATAAITMFAGPRTRGRIWGSGDLCCRTCAQGQARPIYQLDSSLGRGWVSARGGHCFADTVFDDARSV